MLVVGVLVSKHYYINVSKHQHYYQLSNFIVGECW